MNNMNGKPDPEELKELLRNDETNPSNLGAYGRHAGDNRGLEFLYDVPLQISVELGRSRSCCATF